MLHVVQLEEARRLPVLALLRRPHSAERTHTSTDHGDPGEANPLYFRITDPNSLRLPPLTIAFDVDVAMPISAPRMNGNQETVAGVTKACLELTANVTGEQIARDVRRPIEDQASLSFACRRARKSPMQRVHRLAVAILDRNVEPERVVRRWLQEPRPHALP